VNAPPGSFIRLSTDQFAERERIEAAREVFGRTIMNVEFEPLPDAPFNLDLVLRALPDFGLAAGTRSAMNCVRTPQLIDSDDLLFAIVRSGDGLFHFHGREAEISAGAATVLRTGVEGCLCIPSTSELISFRLPLNRIAPLIADLDAVLVRPIPENNVALRLLVHYAGVLRDEDALVTPEVRSLIVTHLYDLAALAIGATRDAAAIAGGRGVPAARLRAIKADIVENLTNRRLSIDSGAVRHGVTPRYVRMLFEGEATTFSEFVVVQRLARAHRMLTDPRFAGRTINAIALDTGFGDLSYFNRTFRRRYGLTPSDVRRRAHESRD
jgi:AraC-like DNA-binding protein